MITDPIFFDEIFRSIDVFLGFSRLSLISYLFMVFLLVFASSLVILLKQKPSVGVFDRSSRGSSIRVSIALALAVSLVLAGLATSIHRYHYTLLFILGLFLLVSLISISLYTAMGADIRVLLISVVVLVAVMGSKHLIVGVEEGETTSDMINIYLNGYFRWSIHGSHYDMAPLDAIAKVILSYIQGSSIYSDVSASILYTSYGLFAVLMIYCLLRRIGVKPHIAIPLIAMVSVSYPYSPILGLSVPPVPMSQVFGVVTIVLALLNIYVRPADPRFYLLSSLFIISSILMHPSSLGLVAFLGVISLAPIILRNRPGIGASKIFISLLIIAATVYLVKVFYTAFATGFMSYIETLINYINAAFGRESILGSFATRNLGYSSLPRILLSSFAILPAVIGSYAVLILYSIVRSKKISFEDYLYLAAVSLYATYTMISLLTGIGGASQSRIIFNGVQPYMELAMILHLAIRVSRGIVDRRVASILLLIPAIATLVTPNAFPFNYTIPMSKPATYNDHLIAYTFMELLDRSLFIRAYQTYGGEAKISAVQERGGMSYGLGSVQAVTYYFIAPRLVDAKSYWDPRIMAIGGIPRDPSQYVSLRVMDAWVYSFYLYVRAG